MTTPHWNSRLRRSPSRSVIKILCTYNWLDNKYILVLLVCHYLVPSNQIVDHS